MLHSIWVLSVNSDGYVMVVDDSGMPAPLLFLSIADPWGFVTSGSSYSSSVSLVSYVILIDFLFLMVLEVLVLFGFFSLPRKKSWKNRLSIVVGEDIPAYYIFYH